MVLIWTRDASVYVVADPPQLGDTTRCDVAQENEGVGVRRSLCTYEMKS